MLRCPNCKKKLYRNYFKGTLECPKEKKGCGYINKEKQQVLNVNNIQYKLKGEK